MQSYSAQQISALVGGRLIGRAEERALRGVTSDSRTIKPGNIFVAVNGNGADGHDFVSQAVAAGAGLLVVSDELRAEGHAGVLVADTRRALSILAAEFSGHPSREMKVVGITGTNGKTTTNWLLYHVLNDLGWPCIRFGTLGTRAEGIIDDPGVLTTPAATTIHADLRRACSGGIVCAVMETSSHALDQCRADDVAFDAGVFTNLTRDHLDYHASMEEYFLAKRRLFELISEGSKATRAAVINLDDEYGLRLWKDLDALRLNDFSFGRSEKARFRILDFKQSMRGSETQVAYGGKSYSIRTRLIGEHNAQNLCGTFAVCISLGLEPDRVIAALGKSPQAPGRLESVGDAGFGIFVDYAHTPDALENVLEALRPLTQGSLWTIFGCGGDRDRGKRPQMAEIAARLSDKVVVTSDNPRTEDPKKIIEDILAQGARAYLVDTDRRSAIEKTLRQCRPGDIVLIAGKGHENYQVIGTQKIHFSDQEVARETLTSLGLTA